MLHAGVARQAISPGESNMVFGPDDSLADCGSLVVVAAFKDKSYYNARYWSEETAWELDASKVRFSASVLDCGHHPEKPGSIKWFSYMLVNRCRVLELVEEEVGWDGIPAYASADNLDSMLLRYFEGRLKSANSHAMPKTKANFHYAPPIAASLEAMYEAALDRWKGCRGR